MRFEWLNKAVKLMTDMIDTNTMTEDAITPHLNLET